MLFQYRQVLPRSVERYAPPSLPCTIRDGFAGSIQRAW
jgi:hypothetical protein